MLNRIAMLVVVGLVAVASVALAQAPMPSDPLAWLKGIFYNPLTLVVVGIVIQFVPGIRRVIGNYAIPFITTALAWLNGLINPTAAAQMSFLPIDPTASTHSLLAFIGSVTPMAHADTGVATVGVFALFGIGLGGLFGGLGSAVLQSAQAYLMQRMFAWPGKTLPGLPKDSKMELV